MDRRQTPRFPTHLPASLTLLADDERIREPVKIPVTVQDISEGGARLQCPRHLPHGAAVSVTLNDCLYLGEIAHCRAEGDSYQVGIALDQALSPLCGLRNLMRALMEEDHKAGIPRAFSQAS